MNEQPTERPKCCPNCGREETDENFFIWGQDPYAVEMSPSWEQEDIPFEWMCYRCVCNSADDI